MVDILQGSVHTRQTGQTGRAEDVHKTRNGQSFSKHPIFCRRWVQWDEFQQTGMAGTYESCR